MFRRQKLSDNIQNMFWPIRLQSMLDDTISDLIYYRLLNFAKKTLFMCSINLLHGNKAILCEPIHYFFLHDPLF